MIVFLLQALDGEHEWLKENLMSFLTTSGMSLTSADIIAHIETKAQDTRTREALSKHETALITRQQKFMQKKMRATCTNCSKMGHTVEKCWEPGGGSAGKAPDWFRNAKAKKNGSGDLRVLTGVTRSQSQPLWIATRYM